MPTGMGGNAPSGGKDGANDKDDPNKKKKKRFEPRPTASAASRNSRRRRRKGPSGLNKTPTIQPISKCKLRLLKLDRVRGKFRVCVVQQMFFVFCFCFFEKMQFYLLLGTGI